MRLQRRTGDWLHVHCVLQVKENMENTQQPVIVCTNQVLSAHEAPVMQANSWLYHYYMVQSKLQYGLAYDTTAPPSRMLSSYYQAGQPAAAGHQPPASFAHAHHPAEQTEHGEHAHAYHHQHIHDTAASLAAHHRHGYPDKQLADAKPVDYSLHQQQHHGRCTSPTTHQHHAYAKRKNGEYDDENSGSPTPEEIDRVSAVGCTGGGGEGGLLCVSSAAAGIHSSTKTRLQLKSTDPADFMEQWNPSPPWSDTLQKVPDIMHHDLSPYMTTTPPTPSATPGDPGPHVAFTFDWMPEQYVPNLAQVKSALADEPEYHVSWEHGHRVFQLQPPPRGHALGAVVQTAAMIDPPKTERPASPPSPDNTPPNSCVNSC